MSHIAVRKSMLKGKWFWICTSPTLCSFGHSVSWDVVTTAAQCHWNAKHKVVSNASRPISTSRD